MAVAATADARVEIGMIVGESYPQGSRLILNEPTIPAAGNYWLTLVPLVEQEVDLKT